LLFARHRFYAGRSLDTQAKGLNGARNIEPAPGWADEPVTAERFAAHDNGRSHSSTFSNDYSSPPREMTEAASHMPEHPGAQALADRAPDAETPLPSWMPRKREDEQRWSEVDNANRPRRRRLE
jgi:hypothetical protein